MWEEGGVLRGTPERNGQEIYWSRFNTCLHEYTHCHRTFPIRIGSFTLLKAIKGPKITPNNQSRELKAP